MTISSCINTIEDIFQLTRSRGAWLRRSGNGGFLLYFNSHAHVERDGNTLCCFACLSLFQLTRSRGAWRIIINTDTNSTDFNSHAHVERDDFATGWIKAYCISTHTLTWSVTQLFWLQWFCHTISTHTLTWSVTCWQGEDNPCTVHFNSHAHVERDCYDVKSYINIFISTHTLTWSVTLTRRLKRSSSTFQLTRSRGAWPKQLHW